MTNTALRRKSWIAFLFASFAILQMQPASACSRAVYYGQ